MLHKLLCSIAPVVYHFSVHCCTKFGLEEFFRLLRNMLGRGKGEWRGGSCENAYIDEHTCGREPKRGIAPLERGQTDLQLLRFSHQ